jgi:LacI family transcriptional regulator, repressor for deo operon, udp, cdd, tsx, nupC, and nupG
MRFSRWELIWFVLPLTPYSGRLMKAVTESETSGDRPATIADVARLASVSEATVSRALRNMPYVRPEVRQKVREAATQLNYVADPNASRLASGRTKTIGLVAPQLSTWYVNQVSAGLEDVLQPADHDLLISALSTPDRRRDLVAGNTNLNQRVDGVVLVDVFLGSSWQRAKGNQPIVFVGERVDGEHTLGIDDARGAALAAEHLLSLGYRKLGIIGSASPRARFSPVTKLRIGGFRRCLEEQGVGAPLEIPSDFTVESGAQAARVLMEIPKDSRPTAVFCLSDEMAFGALQALREMGVDVPGEIAVVGFDDHSVADAFGLTTIHQPVRELGRRAAQRMLNLVDRGGGPAGHEILSVELVVRSSTVR